MLEGQNHAGDFSGSVFSSEGRVEGGRDRGEIGALQRGEKFGESRLLFFLCGTLV